jgi:RNA recognition motif-containing protein
VLRSFIFCIFVRYIVKLFVGNLSWGTTEEQLAGHFAQIGAVSSARIITDRETGRSRGFGFVTMSDRSAAQQALTLDKTDLQGRVINVSEARERQ